MKKLSLPAPRIPISFRVDLFRFLPNDKALIAQYDHKKTAIYIGIVKLENDKVRPVLRSAWRGKEPLVKLWKTREGLYIGKL